jgi:hypothetical protein
MFLPDIKHLWKIIDNVIFAIKEECNGKTENNAERNY